MAVKSSREWACAQLQFFGPIEAKWGNVLRTDVFPPGRISEAAWSVLLRIQYSKYSTKDHFFPCASMCWNPQMGQSMRSTGLRSCWCFRWGRWSPLWPFQGVIVRSGLSHIPQGNTSSSKSWAQHWHENTGYLGTELVARSVDQAQAESHFYTRFLSLLGSERTLRPDLDCPRAVDGGAAPASNNSPRSSHCLQLQDQRAGAQNFSVIFVKSPEINGS